MNENSKKNQWPESISGTTSSYVLPKNSIALNNVLDCVNNLATKFNEHYISSEKLLAVATGSSGYQSGGRPESNGSVSFHVSSLETNKSRKIIHIELLDSNTFDVSLSFFTSKGRVEVGEAKDCKALEKMFFEAITNDEVTNQIAELRKNERT